MGDDFDWDTEFDTEFDAEFEKFLEGNCVTIVNPESGETSIVDCETMTVQPLPSTTQDAMTMTEVPGFFKGPPETVETKTHVHTTISEGSAVTTAIEPSRNRGGAGEASATATAIPTVVGGDGNDDSSSGLFGQSRGGNGGIAPGAVAGIAISTAIIGAAIAFLVAFLLFKRRNHRERQRSNAALRVSESHPDFSAWPKPEAGTIYQMPQHQASHSRNISMASETGANASTPLNTFRHNHGAASSATIFGLAEANNIPKPTAPATASTQDYLTSLGGILPPPTDTEAIRAKFSALFDQIHSHVETFYRDVNASITLSMEPSLAQFGRETGEGGMAGLLQRVGRPTTAIKHALTAYVMGIAGQGGEEGEGRSLFPKEVVGMSEKLGRERMDSDTATALTLYRRISAHLYTTLCTPESRRTSVLESAQHFALTFFPWANPLSSDTEKDEELAQIINDAVDAVLWLYGEGKEFEWRWGSAGMGDVTVRPGLELDGVKVMDPVTEY